MKEEFQLRPSSSSDYVEISAWVTDATLCGQWVGPSITYPLCVDRLQTDLTKEGQRSFTLVDAGTAVGFGQFWVIENDSVHIGRVIVSPQHRCKGVGRHLMEALITRAVASMAVNRVTLRVARGNDRACALYESMGFHVVPMRSTPDVLFMQRSL